MTYFAPRTCHYFSEGGRLSEFHQPFGESEASTSTEASLQINKKSSVNKSLTLEQLCEVPAFVLLGPPGAGKTEIFKKEGRKSNCHYETVREFANLDQTGLNSKTTLFIDALDEQRLEFQDGRTALYEVCQKLEMLGNPRFRLSCREADWFGTSDRTHLKSVSPDGQISVYRLDPLTNEQVIQLLASLDIEHPESFVESVRNNQLAELLYNPHTLKMLVEAFRESGEKRLPRTRTEMFELACLKLLKDPDRKRQQAYQTLEFNPEDLLDKAGKLCAIQLLSGKQGYTQVGGIAAPDFPDLNQVLSGDGTEVHRIVRSNLFHTPSENRVVPIHRHVAEFLAGRYLRKLIDEGLPLSRVMSLIIGYDDSVVSDLRGLSAWLSVHCVDRRKQIMERDSLGTLLYGDVKSFLIDEKIYLLKLLHQNLGEDLWHVRKHGVDVRFGDVATQDSVNEIQKIFWESVEAKTESSLCWIVIAMLRYSEPLQGLSKFLLAILKHDSISSSIKTNAIEALVHQCGGITNVYAELKVLLDDLYEGKVRDPDCDLTNGILIKLYPEFLNASELLKYFRMPDVASISIDYHYFWRNDVPEISTADQLACLLDQLTQIKEKIRLPVQFANRWPFSWRNLARTWLRKYLDKLDGEVDRYRLFDWLGFASGVDDWEEYSVPNGNDSTFIRSWIEKHPDLHQWLLEQGLSICIENQNFNEGRAFGQCVESQWKRQFGAQKPENYGLWCIRKGLELSDEHAENWLIHEAAVWISDFDRNQGDSTNEVYKLFQQCPELKKVFDKELGQLESKKQQFLKQSRQQGDQQSQKEWREFLKPYEIALRENRVGIQLLSRLASVYLGAFLDINGNSPKARVRNLVGDDSNLVNAVLQSLRNSINRSDIPSDDEVIILHCENKRHFLAFPILAGMIELTANVHEYAINLDQEKLRLLIALHYTEPYWRTPKDIDTLSEPKFRWFPGLLTNHPELVAMVLFKFASAQFRKGKGGIEGLYELAYSEDHKQLAQLVSLRLLKTFPIRCRESQLRDLRNLLTSALLLHNERNRLIELIEKKLCRKSMNAGQRVFWLLAGMLISSNIFVDRLNAHVVNYKKGPVDLERCLVEFFYGSTELFEWLEPEGIKLLVRHVGPNSPTGFDGLDTHTHQNRSSSQRMSAGDCVRELIEQLASNSSVSATTALQELTEDDNLTGWREMLLNAANLQQRKRKEAEYRQPSLQQVSETLRNCKPANPADLAALVEDKLRHIAYEVRNGPASGWRQYWNVDSHNRPVEPRHENACRDTLISDLRNHVRSLDIDVQPEGRYADDKRSDIRVCFNKFNVPIELKKSDHSDVWSAILNQLVNKYTRDPGADGYGIYGVFWFGFSDYSRPKPGVSGLPKSPEEFERSLKKSLPTELRRKISVCVFDVSQPTG